MNEKLKTQSGAVYELVPNGAYFADDTAKLIFVFPDGKTYEQVETDIEGNDRLQILDASGETVETKIGYSYLDGITKKNDYVIDTKQVEAGTDEAGETLYTTENVIGTALIVNLKKADLRTEVDAAKKQIANLNETVDMLILSNLEG